MTKKPTKQLPSTGARWAIGVFLVVVVGLIVLAFSWLWARPQAEPVKTYPLSGEFEYIGKKDYGCSLICDAQPGSTYYYGTDLSFDEIKLRFGKGSERWGPTSAGDLYTYRTAIYSTADDKLLFTVNYIDERDAAIKANDLKVTTKKALITVDSNDYRLVKERAGI